MTNPPVDFYRYVFPGRVTEKKLTPFANGYTSPPPTAEPPLKGKPIERKMNMKKEIILSRKLVCRIVTGENALDELLEAMYLKETAEIIKGWVKKQIPIHIIGGEDKGCSLLCKAIINAGGIAFTIEDIEQSANIPMLVLTRKVSVEHSPAEVRKTVQTAVELLGDNREISAFYKIGPNRWAVEVNDEYFGIYDTEKKTFVD